MQTLEYQPAYILPASMRAVDAQQFAQAKGCKLYINRKGRVIAAPCARPGWQRVGVFVRESA